MAAINTGIPIHNNLNVKALDLSKLETFKVSEAPEDFYKNYMQGQERFLESLHTTLPDISNNPTYAGYAQVEVDGKVVAKIDNHGGVESSNSTYAKIKQAIEDADRHAQTLQGPKLAQARAEKIAEALGGEVIKLPSALTQLQFNGIPQPSAEIDYEALYNDPMYEQLQKTKASRTLFLAQTFA